MRKSVFAAIVFAALGVGMSQAAAITNLTQSQVKNVCGPNLQSGGGHFGCTKACGQNKDQQCIYDCSEKTGNCSGLVVPKGQARVAPTLGGAAVKVGPRPKAAQD